jgi:endonuclease IV
VIIEYSTMCLNTLNYKDKIREAKRLVESNGFDFGVQFHNSITKDLFEKVCEFKDEIKLSVHSPVFSKYFINLSSSDFELTKQSCDDNIKYLKQIGTDIFFFHSMFLTDTPIVHDMKNYRKVMKEGIGNEFSLNGSFTMDPKIFNSPIFEKYKHRFIGNYQKIKELYPSFIVSLENDFVGIGSGLQRAQEVDELIENLWFDLGHFWCASLVHEFDFYDYCEKFIKEKNIVGVHLNHSFMTRNTPKEKMQDSHAHIYEKSAQELKPIVRKVLEKDINILTLEIVDGDIHDIETLLDWMG